MLQLAIELHARMQSELSKSKQAMLMLSRMRAVVVCAECGGRNWNWTLQTTDNRERGTRAQIQLIDLLNSHYTYLYKLQSF